MLPAVVVVSPVPAAMSENAAEKPVMTAPLLLAPLPPIEPTVPVVVPGAPPAGVWVPDSEDEQ